MTAAGPVHGVAALPVLLQTAQELEERAARREEDRHDCWAVSARTYHLAATTLAKIGESDIPTPPTSTRTSCLVTSRLMPIMLAAKKAEMTELRQVDGSQMELDPRVGVAGHASVTCMRSRHR